MLSFFSLLFSLFEFHLTYVMSAVTRTHPQLPHTSCVRFHWDGVFGYVPDALVLNANVMEKR